jgi:hypothetical protein
LCWRFLFWIFGGDVVKDNTVKSEVGIEVYQNDILRLVDEYIDTELDGDSESVGDNFVSMIFYIADNIQKPSHDDIELLDNLFSIYVRICAKYKVLPTLEVFSFLTGIHRTTFTDWANGLYRVNSAHGITVKKWFDVCKSFTLNRLHNQSGTNANLIFVAKAAYGMAETAPVQVGNQNNQALADSELPKLTNPAQEAIEIEQKDG